MNTNFQLCVKGWRSQKFDPRLSIFRRNPENYKRPRHWIQTAFELCNTPIYPRIHCTKNEVSHYGFLQEMWPNPQFPADLVTFTTEIRIGKLHFCAVIEALNLGQNIWNKVKKCRKIGCGKKCRKIYFCVFLTSAAKV